MYTLTADVVEVSNGGEIVFACFQKTQDTTSKGHE